MARSSSGPGHRPLKAEITGSTPVRATPREIIYFPFLFIIQQHFLFSQSLLEMSIMGRYEKHLFICENKRDINDTRGCCADKNSLQIRDLFKKRIKELGLNKKIRANGAGCLDACAFGPSMVVYPEQIWYGGIKAEDVEEIIQSHLINNNPVARLLILDKKFRKDD